MVAFPLNIVPKRPDQNPFRSERIDGLEFVPQDATWDELLARLEALGRRAAIVGPEGSGKTTLIERLAGAVPGGAIVRLRGGEADPYRAAIRQLSTTSGTVFLDGAEQLGTVAWWRFERRVRRAPGLIVTTHLPGRLPTLVECTTSPTLLRHLVARLAPDDSQTLDPILDDLFELHQGDIRSCFRSLYDLYAGRPSETHP
jgi:hypothetical protein